MVNGSADNVIIPKRVALVGLGPTSLDYVPWVDVVGDRKLRVDHTWVINSYASVFEHELVFHMDDVRVQEKRAKNGNQKVQGLLSALKSSRTPVMTSTPHEDYPMLIPFPLKEVLDRYGSVYFNNTVAYAVAYAHYIGVEELYVFGVDFTWPNVHEAESGRGCVEYWLGRAEANGMKVRVANGSTLMDSRNRMKGEVRLYGYDGMVGRMNGEGGLTFYSCELPEADAVEKAYGLELVEDPEDGTRKTWLRTERSTKEAGVPDGTLGQESTTQETESNGASTQVENVGVCNSVRDGGREAGPEDQAGDEDSSRGEGGSAGDHANGFDHAAELREQPMVGSYPEQELSAQSDDGRVQDRAVSSEASPAAGQAPVEAVGDFGRDYQSHNKKVKRR